MSAPVTESHKRLVATIVERAFRFAEGNHKITPELGKLIADSEARATDQLRAEVERLKSDGAASAFSNMACRASRAETERNNLRADLDAIKAILTEEKARAERAEAELKDRAAMMRDVMRERDAAEISLTAERAIVSRIWVQLGSPTYEQLKGRSIYDLIDEMKAELAAERARLSELKAKGCEALIIATTWAHVWGDKLSPDSLRDFKKHEAAFLADAAMKEGAK